MRSSAELPIEIRRLRCYLFWGGWVTLAALISTITTIALGHNEITGRSTVAFTLTLATLIMFPLSFAVSHYLAGQRRVDWALGITIAAHFIAAIVFISLSPISVTNLILLPILVISLALPHITIAKARILIFWSIAVCVYISILGSRSLQTGKFDLRFGTFAIPLIVSLIFLLLYQFHAQLTESLIQTRVAQHEAEQARNSLEIQVAERTSELQQSLVQIKQQAEAQAKLIEEVAQQREVIREISVPILPVTDQIIVMPLVGALDGERLHDVQERALHELQHTRARYLLLDITGVPIVDTHVAQGLIQVVNAAKLLGATVALIGIRPEVAQAVVSLGLKLDTVQTYRDLQTALKEVQFNDSYSSQTRRN